MNEMEKLILIQNSKLIQISELSKEKEKSLKVKKLIENLKKEFH